jgi:hypothetical protein
VKGNHFVKATLLLFRSALQRSNVYVAQLLRDQVRDVEEAEFKVLEPRAIGMLAEEKAA